MGNTWKPTPGLAPPSRFFLIPQASSVRFPVLTPRQLSCCQGPAFGASRPIRKPTFGHTLSSVYDSSLLLHELLSCPRRPSGRSLMGMQEKIASGPSEAPLSPSSLCVPAGDCLVRHISFVAADGSPLDISDPGVSIRWQILTPDGVEMLSKKTGDPGVTIISAIDGLVRLVLTPRETRLFAPGIYRDIGRAILPGGVFARSAGRLEIFPASR
jgi:hypothetical protein